MKRSALTLMPTVLALAVGMAMPAVQAAINSDASVVGTESQWWNTYKVTLTNNGNQPVELRDASIAFDTNLSLSTPSWSAQGISYPSMSFSSNAQGSVFSNRLTLSFDQGSWVKTQLLPGASIDLTLGVSGVLELSLLQSTIALETDGEVEPGEPEISLELASPVQGAEFIEGQTVAIVANVTATNTTVKTVTFLVDGEQIALLEQAPFQASWTAAGEGGSLHQSHRGRCFWFAERASGTYYRQSRRN